MSHTVTSSQVCPLCDGECRTIWRDHGFVAGECNHCAMIVSKGPQVHEFKKSYYEHYVESPAARALRVQHFRCLLASLPVELKAPILDVGAGLGFFASSLSDRQQQDMTLLEPAAFARAYLKKNVCQQAVASFGDIPPNTKPFATITFWDVLAHVENPLEILAQARDRLQSDGVLVVKTPHHPRRLFRATRLCSSLRLSRALLHIPSMRFHFVPETLERLLSRAGFRLECWQWTTEAPASVRRGSERLKGLILRRAKSALTRNSSFVAIARPV